MKNKTIYRSRLNFSMSVLLVKEGIQLFNRKISNRISIFTLLSVILISLPPVSQAGTGDCENAITGKDLILERITKDRASFIRDYQGQRAYLHFTEELPIQLNMAYVFIVVSQNLSEKEKKDLNWQQFQGTTEEYRELRELILDNQGNIKSEYIGMDGYTSFANTHFEGDMQKTYKNISAVLGGVKATRALGLQWKSFQGTTSQFYALKELFKRYGVEQLRGSDGQKKVAREIFKGNRQRTYHNVSILREELLGSKTAFNELKWQRTGKN